MKIGAMKTQKVVMITGASAGIGAALARQFQSSGFQVVLLARRMERLEVLAKNLNSVRAGSALALECDVTHAEQLKTAVGSALAAFGRIDGFVANAGFGVAGKVESLSVGDYRRQFETNVFSVIESFKQVQGELEKSRGFFTVVGSVNSYLSLPTASAYAMSKFAVRAFTEALYWEMKGNGVSITLACPGFIETEIRKVNNEGVFHERARDPVPEWIMMSADQAAGLIARASIKRKKEVRVTLHGKVLIFIARHMPWVLSPFLNRVSRGREKWNEVDSEGR